MKRILICVCVILCLCLCGCNRAAEYSEPEQVIITAALGFDNESGQLCVSAETVKTNTDSSYEPQVITDKGYTVEQVIQSISDNLGGKLFLGHCATIVLGNSLTQDQLENIIQFCKDSSEMSLAVKLIATHNAVQLLSCKSYSGEAVGYDIIKLMGTKGDVAAPDTYAQLFHIENLRSTHSGSFTLPHFSAETSENGATLSPDGADVFSGSLRIYKLKKEQDILLKILSNGYSGTTMTVNNNGSILQAKIEKSRCKIDKSFQNNTLFLDCTVKLTLEQGGFKGENASEFGKVIENKLGDFFTLMQTEIRQDILHITDSIEKYQPMLFKRIEKDPLDAFLRANIKVRCIVSGGDRQ